MKTLWTLRTLVAAAALVLGSFSLPAHAQSHNLTVNVPFGFEVGSKHLPPGVYSVSTPTSDIIEIRNRSGAAMILTHGGQSFQPTRTAKLVFRRYGEHYFLGQVWFNATDTTYMETPKSKSEKLAKAEDLASNQTAPPTVEVALLHRPQ